MKETVTMSASSKAPPVAKPLSTYTPIANFDSFDKAKPIREMPWSAETRYQLLSDNEKALKPPNTAVQFHATQTTRSDRGKYPAQGIYNKQVIR
jgi:hypothetical protein